MTFEEVKAGQQIEHNKTYYTEYLFILAKRKNLITALKDTSDNIIERVIISKLVWDEDHQKADILVNREEARERKKDLVIFLWSSNL